MEQKKSNTKIKPRFLFGKESYNLQYFSIYYHDTVNLQLQAQLGKLLFFDPAKYQVPNQTLPFDSLKLTQKETADIVLFLKTLSDTTGLSDKPKRLPFFENEPSLNKRLVGGEY